MSTCLNLYSATLTPPVPATPAERACLGLKPDNTELSLEEWAANWATPLVDDPRARFCSQLYADTIYSLGADSIFDPTEYERISEQYEYMLSRYFNTTLTGHNIALPGAIDYYSFQDTLITSCREVGGVCHLAQEKLCDGCIRTEISNNAALIGLCGCYSPNLDPVLYKREIPKACDPLCNNGKAAKLTDPETGAESRCTDTVCVLDNLSINAAKSTLGGVQLTQICAGCGTGCTCIIDTSVLNLTAGIGLDNPALFQQYCPPTQATCLVIDSRTQSSTVVPCADKISGTRPSFSSAIPTLAYFVLALIVIVFLLILAAYWYAASSKRIFVAQPRAVETLAPLLKPDYSHLRL